MSNTVAVQKNVGVYKKKLVIVLSNNNANLFNDVIFISIYSISSNYAYYNMLQNYGIFLATEIPGGFKMGCTCIIIIQTGLREEIENAEAVLNINSTSSDEPQQQEDV
jgi:hypothetical protein